MWMLSAGADDTVVLCAPFATSPRLSVIVAWSVRMVPFGRTGATRAVTRITPLVPTFRLPIVHLLLVVRSAGGVEERMVRVGSKVPVTTTLFAFSVPVFV